MNETTAVRNICQLKRSSELLGTSLGYIYKRITIKVRWTKMSKQVSDYNAYACRLCWKKFIAEIN